MKIQIDRAGLVSVLMVLVLTAPMPNVADTLDCNDLFVGSISARNGSLDVVFLNDPGNSSGSYAQGF